jgi:hypothetical protein
MIKPGSWHNMRHSWEHHSMHHGHDDAHGKDGGHSLKLNEAPSHSEGKAMLTSNEPEPKAESGHDEIPAHGEDVHGAPHGGEEAHGHGEAHGHDGAHGHEEAHTLKNFYMGIHFPGLLEIGTFLGFLGLFLYVTFSFLAKASLNPKNDPYFQESNHHQVL